ncbi:hypothetical protein [Tabrizicola fusiformis]|uniref:hypothetical protein n=1 Tax=Tabrizicola sp. SY72 TaxID=2741673 RepID=UPI001572950E|nr:hypothetical protein [Tabrizicola sp. SY72]
MLMPGETVLWSVCQKRWKTVIQTVPTLVLIYLSLAIYVLLVSLVWIWPEVWIENTDPFKRKLVEGLSVLIVIAALIFLLGAVMVTYLFVRMAFGDERRLCCFLLTQDRLFTVNSATLKVVQTIALSGMRARHRTLTGVSLYAAASTSGSGKALVGKVNGITREDGTYLVYLINTRLPSMRELMPDPAPKPPKSDARIGGMVAAAVLVFLVLFTVAFVVMAT